MDNIIYLLHVWLLPPGLIIGLGIMAMVMLKFNPKISKYCMGLAFLSLWLLSTPFFTEQLLKPLQTLYPTQSVLKGDKKNSSLVVLGAGSEQSLLRAGYAAKLHKKNLIPIIVSGGNKNAEGITEAQLMQDLLNKDFHIPVLAFEDKSKKTVEETQWLLPIITHLGIKKIYIVTHAYHMPRAIALFKRAFANTGIEVNAAPLPPRSILSNNRLANFMPQIYAFNMSELAMHEYMGMLFATYWH